VDEEGSALFRTRCMAGEEYGRSDAASPDHLPLSLPPVTVQRRVMADFYPKMERKGERS